LHFAPSTGGRSVPDSASILRSNGTRSLINDFRQHYQYIIIDFPALECSVDTNAGAELVDLFFLVVKWGRTSGLRVTQALHTSGMVQAKLGGAVLNMADRLNSEIYERL
jgi:polysaccharide biosynthesis transport protein